MISVSTVSSLPAVAAPNGAVRNPASGSGPRSVGNTSSDLVQLQPGGGLSNLVQPTEAQRVQELYRQGHTIPQISSSLNLSAQAVDTYLNISQSGK